MYVSSNNIKTETAIYNSLFVANMYFCIQLKYITIQRKIFDI